MADIMARIRYNHMLAQSRTGTSNSNGGGGGVNLDPYEPNEYRNPLPPSSSSFSMGLGDGNNSHYHRSRDSNGNADKEDRFTIRDTLDDEDDNHSDYNGGGGEGRLASLRRRDTNKGSMTPDSDSDMEAYMAQAERELDKYEREVATAKLPPNKRSFVRSTVIADNATPHRPAPSSTVATQHFQTGNHWGGNGNGNNSTSSRPTVHLSSSSITSAALPERRHLPPHRPSTSTSSSSRSGGRRNEASASTTTEDITANLVNRMRPLDLETLSDRVFFGSSSSGSARSNTRQSRPTQQQQPSSSPPPPLRSESTIVSMDDDDDDDNSAAASLSRAKVAPSIQSRSPPSRPGSASPGSQSGWRGGGGGGGPSNQTSPPPPPLSSNFPLRASSAPLTPSRRDDDYHRREHSVGRDHSDSDESGFGDGNGEPRRNNISSSRHAHSTSSSPRSSWAKSPSPNHNTNYHHPYRTNSVSPSNVSPSRVGSRGIRGGGRGQGDRPHSESPEQMSHQRQRGLELLRDTQSELRRGRQEKGKEREQREGSYVHHDDEGYGGGPNSRHQSPLPTSHRQGSGHNHNHNVSPGHANGGGEVMNHHNYNTLDDGMGLEIELAERYHWKEAAARDFFGEGVSKLRDCQGCVLKITSPATADTQPDMANLIMDLFRSAGSCHLFVRCENVANKFNMKEMPKYNRRVMTIAGLTDDERTRMLLKPWSGRSVYDHITKHDTTPSVKATLLREDLAIECEVVRNKMYIRTRKPGTGDDGADEYDEEIDPKMAIQYMQFVKLTLEVSKHPVTMNAIAEGNQVQSSIINGTRLSNMMSETWSRPPLPIVTLDSFLTGCAEVT